jgi:primosomal protein N' (replication factor Y)
MNILFRAVKETLQRKRRVLILTGAIGRAQEIAESLTRADIDDVVLFHGDLTVREKALVWQAMASPPVKVVVGTRSAACSPMPDLGLVWLEGEEDAAFKEEQSPRYHAREIARMRAQLDHAILVLASPHPSLESLHAAMTGRALSWSIPADGRHPTAEIVDLRRFPAGTLLSPPVIEAIRTALSERKLIVLFLNRKGYAALLSCRACGSAPCCPACSLALRFHKRGGILMCHSCGYQRGVPEVCPACQAARLQPLGAGTERVEEILRQHFPSIRVARMDGDSIQRSAEAEAVLALARAGDIDVIIGTQMLFVHGEIPPAGLVVALNADAGLHMPDFRSAEQAYHALLDAVSLSGAKEEGRALIQTRLPHHHAIQAVTQGKPSLFIDTELAFRETLQYPPFTYLIRLDVSGTSERHVRLAAEQWAATLQRTLQSERRPSERPALSSREASGQGSVSVLGPAPAPRLRRRYYWRLLVRSSSQDQVLRVVRNTLPDMEESSRSGGIRFSVDVDPVTML